MRRWLQRFHSWDSEHKANGLAALILGAAVAGLYLECPPTPAGAETLRLAHAKPAKIISDAPAAQPAAAADLTPEQLAERTLRRKVELLQQGREFLQNTPDYIAQFSRQELVDGELLEEQQIYMKVRHAPFSVYLKWHTGDEGREVIYIDGENDGKMVVHAGGWKARLPALTIDPEGSLAMQDSRYPVTKAGLLELTKMLLDAHVTDLSTSNYVRCEQIADQEFDGRQCDAFVIEYRNAAQSATYRKSITLLDKQHHIPLYVRNFGWPDANMQDKAGEELDEATLIEFYTFSEIQFRPQLAALDFDRANEDYRFR